MDVLIYFLLGLSITLSTVRNVFSKKISGQKFGSKGFFIAQAIIFLSGGIATVLLDKNFFDKPMLLTICYAVIYGLLLIFAQWCYTAALKNINTGICSTVYSLGFILPTVSGTVFWKEELSRFDIIGILLVIPAIIITGMNKGENNKKQNRKYIIPLVIAMISSGGLGIMQKVQQNSLCAEQKSLFIVTAFAFAGIASLICALYSKSDDKGVYNKALLHAAFAGGAFGCCNYFNTILAGKLDSGVFFPILNIGIILCSLMAGIVLFREKPSKKDFCVLFLGGISIVLITVV